LHFLLIVARVAILGRRFDAQLVGAASGLLRPDVELHRHDFAATAQGHALARFQLAFVALCAVGCLARQKVDRHGPIGQTFTLQVPGDVEAVARIGSGRGHQVADADVGRAAVGADAHGVNWYFGFAGRGYGDRRIDAGVLSTIAEDNDGRDRRGPLVGDYLSERLSEPGFAALRRKGRLPIDRRLGWPLDGRGARRGLFVSRLAGRLRCRRHFRQRGHAIQIAVKPGDQHVVLLAQLVDELAVAQHSGDLLQPVRRGGHGRRRGVVQAHAQAGIDQHQGPRVMHHLALGAFFQMQVKSQQAGQCRQAQGKQQDADSGSQLDRVAAIHPHREADYQGAERREHQVVPALAVGLQSRELVAGARRCLGK
jgi:hypothetical protein